jgi:hypothetical protein
MFLMRVRGTSILFIASVCGLQMDARAARFNNFVAFLKKCSFGILGTVAPSQLISDNDRRDRHAYVLVID